MKSAPAHQLRVHGHVEVVPFGTKGGSAFGESTGETVGYKGDYGRFEFDSAKFLN